MNLCIIAIFKEIKYFRWEILREDFLFCEKSYDKNMNIIEFY